MARRVRHPRCWSAHLLWLAQCSRRFWLACPQQRIKPPLSPIQALGTSVHEIIFETLKTNASTSLAEIFAAFSKKFLTQTPDPKLLSCGERCLRNFFDKYFVHGDRTGTQSVNVELAIAVSRNIEPVMDWTSPCKPAYQLFGIADEIRKENSGLGIRDFKLAYREDEDSLFRYRLQFGVYRACLKPKTEQEIFCEIFDLKTNEVSPVEPFSRGQIHALVMKAEKRIGGGPRSKNLNLCLYCPYQPICQNLYSASKQWKRPMIITQQLSLELNP